MTVASVLRAERISVTFQGIKAVHDVSLQIAPDRITGLIGPNGAGKTTLLNVLSGNIKPHAGAIYWEGVECSGETVYQRARKGIARTFQIPRPLNNLTVEENLAIASSFGCIRAAPDLSVENVLVLLGLWEKRNLPAGNLNVAERKRLELGRALCTRPKVLLLDEVMAGLNPVELDRMIELIRLIQQKGIGVLIIEHLMKVVMSLCNYLYVLDHGSLLAQGSPDEILKNESVVKAYLGERYMHGLRSDAAETSRVEGECIDTQ